MKNKEERFQHLVRAYAPMLQRYAIWLSRNPALAEDLVQETFLRAWRSLASLRDEGAAKSWLITILRREHARTFARQRPEIADVELETLTDNSVDEQRDEQRDTLRRAILQLPEHYREPLTMQVLLGMTLDEIGAALELPQNTVATRCARARQKVQDRINQEESLPDSVSGESV